jgi:hypothetical protein
LVITEVVVAAEALNGDEDVSWLNTLEIEEVITEDCSLEDNTELSGDDCGSEVPGSEQPVRQTRSAQ